MQDELDDADFETLFGPWHDALGDDDDDATDETGEPDGGPAAGPPAPRPG